MITDNTTSRQDWKDLFKAYVRMRPTENDIDRFATMIGEHATILPPTKLNEFARKFVRIWTGCCSTPIFLTEMLAIEVADTIRDALSHPSLTDFEIDFLDDLANEVKFHGVTFDVAERIIYSAVRSLWETDYDECESYANQVKIWFHKYYRENYLCER